MKKLFLIFVSLPLISFSQKNNNGKVYDKHPAIDIVNQFTEAWISGDTETLKEITGEGFKMGSSMNCLLYTSPSPRDVEESRFPCWA